MFDGRSDDPETRKYFRERIADKFLGSRRSLYSEAPQLQAPQGSPPPALPPVSDDTDDDEEDPFMLYDTDAESSPQSDQPSEGGSQANEQQQSMKL